VLPHRTELISGNETHKTCCGPFVPPPRSIKPFPGSPGTFDWFLIPQSDKAPDGQGEDADQRLVYLLNSATVYAAAANDVLNGGTGHDWFFAGAGDRNTNRASNETVSIS
jgi:hypothetical protein